jgi:hypothetical protein
VVAEEAPVETQGEGQHRREPGEAIEGVVSENVPRRPSQVSVRTPTTQAMKRNSATMTGRPPRPGSEAQPAAETARINRTVAG